MKIFFKWTLALCSTVLFLALLYSAMIIARVSSGTSQQAKIHKELETNNAVELVLGKKEYLKFEVQDTALLDASIRVSKLIRKAQLDDAQQALKHPLLKTSSKAKELREILGDEEEQEALEPPEEDIFEVATEEKEERFITHPLQERAELAKEYLYISSEFAETLGFEEQSIALLTATSKIKGDKSIKRFKIASYQDGIFTGLPVITGLPEGVPNYLRVEQYLPSATRSKVMANLVRSRSSLRKKLAELQERLKAVSEKFEKNQDAIGMRAEVEESSVPSIEVSNDEIDEDVDPELVSLATQLVSEAIQPKLSNSDRQLHNMAYKSLAPLLAERMPEWFKEVAEK